MKLSPEHPKGAVGGWALLDFGGLLCMCLGASARFYDLDVCAAGAVAGAADEPETHRGIASKKAG